MNEQHSAGSSKERALQSIIKGLRDAGESETSSRGRVYWLAADELEKMCDALERIIHHAPGSWQADIARKVIGNIPTENETNALHRETLERLFERAACDREFRREDVIAMCEQALGINSPALKANACQCDPNPSIGGSPPCPVHDGESASVCTCTFTLGYNKADGKKSCISCGLPLGKSV